MPNSNSIFDIFEYLGIPVTDNLETVQKALDDLPASKMADLRKKPEFSNLRRLLYSKRATPAFLEYVQNVRALRQSNQQNYNQQNYNQRQSNQQNYNQQNYNQRQSNQQNYNQQNYNQQNYNQQNYNQRQSNQQNYNQQNYNHQSYNQQDYDQQDYDYLDQELDDYDDQQLKAQDKKHTLLGCAFLIFVCFCIFSGIAMLFDESGSETLSNPKVKFNDVDRQSVRISWKPVEHADYYILENTSDDLPQAERKKEIRNETEYVVRRHEDKKTSYTLQACSDDEKYTPSSQVRINVDSISNILKESEQNSEDPDDNLNETEPSPESTDDNSGNRSTKEDNQTDNGRKNESIRSGYQTDMQPIYGPEAWGLSKNNNTSSPKSDKTALNPVDPKVIETNDSIVVLWDKINNADRYLLEVKMGSNGKRFSKTIEDNMYKFSNLKPNKEYFITITAVPADEQSFTPSPSKTVSFTVKPK